MINNVVIFSILTLVFGALKYLLRNTKTLQIITILLFFMSVALLQYYVNFSFVKEKCGGKGDFTKAFMNTAIPFFLIFVTVYLLLQYLPHWKSPFSNTLGYLITRLMGVRELLTNDILLANNADASVSIDSATQKSLALIYEDPSLLINSLTPENVTNFTTKSSKLFKPNANAHFQKLYDLVLLKDIVGEFVWYFLSGILATAYSVSNIAKLKCQVTPEDMIKRHRLHNENKKAEQLSNDVSNKKIYTVKH